MKKEIGLLYTPENRNLVRQSLKWQTRRLIKLPDWAATVKPWTGGCQAFNVDETGMAFVKSPYGMPQNDWEGGVSYYLKEPVQIIHPGDNGKMLVKWTDDGTTAWVNVTTDDILKIDDRSKGWETPTTAMFMLKSFARTWLPGVKVWPERLGDMPAEDAIAEGIELDPAVVVTPGDFDEMKSWEFSQVWRDYLNGGHDLFPVQSYASLWNSINAKKSPWSPDTWVWCVEHKSPTTETKP